MNTTLKKLLLKKPSFQSSVALLGDRNGNVAAGYNSVFVRLPSGEVLKVQEYNNIPRVKDLRVVIRKDPYGAWEVYRVMEEYVSVPNKNIAPPCAYCGSSAMPDLRGNCGACGAPIRL